MVMTHGWKVKLLSFGGKICLLKSVLSSIPIHSLSCIKAPNAVLQILEQAMADFLWNSAGRKRCHWLAWKNVCKPLQEGMRGLGLRSLHAKLAWSVLQGRSSSAQFVNGRYKKASGLISSLGSSHVWKAVLAQLDTVQNHSRQLIGKGHCSFWLDNWCGAKVLCHVMPVYRLVLFQRILMLSCQGCLLTYIRLEKKSQSLKLRRTNWFVLLLNQANLKLEHIGIKLGINFVILLELLKYGINGCL